MGKSSRANHICETPETRQGFARPLGWCVWRLFPNYGYRNWQKLCYNNIVVGKVCPWDETGCECVLERGMWEQLRWLFATATVELTELG